MSGKDFRVTFHGEVMQGWDPDEVKANMATLFKLDPQNRQHVQKLDRLFSGRTVIIKDGLSATTAQAYVDAIAKVGGDARAKKKSGPPNNASERRLALRRKQGDRRRSARLSAIMPNRRKNRGRRHADLMI
ncbi:MAG: hypothetical protein V7745_01350 [Pseudomonadales bacterium]